MTSHELRRKFIQFFVERGHTEIASASLLPENDPSVLFTTAGMHPLVPYLLGEKHPSGTRLVNAQKCIRTGDIDEVGDNRHLTFFEMLGNWSLGDYFKEDSIKWSYEFLTDKKWLGLDPKKIAVTVFAGDDSAPRDEFSASLWKTLGIPDNRIAYLLKDDNWWPAGGKHPGPQGPDTEIFYWTGSEPTPEIYDPSNALWVEIWNNVFMEFKKDAETGALSKLSKTNVDTGMGLERITMVVQGKSTVFETELFTPLFEILERLSGKKYGADPETTRLMRIVADHIKAATCIMGDRRGVGPSNVDQGYIVRRLIRRAIRHGRQIGITDEFCNELALAVTLIYKDSYPEFHERMAFISDELRKEEEKFSKTLADGSKEFEKISRSSHEMISGNAAFLLFSSFGFPLELTKELAAERGLLVEEDVFNNEFEKHQALSRAGAGQKFAGGLADHDPRTIHGHTATHLLHKALQQVLGEHVAQKGSNITAERLRFDFSQPTKLTPEQLKEVEEMVQSQIKKDLPVHFEILSIEDAKRRGAIGLFEDKYALIGDQIKVYFIGDDTQGFFSTEICGGPHVEHTGEIGSFKIIKEEAVSSGIRRIKAVVG